MNSDTILEFLQRNRKLLGGIILALILVFVGAFSFFGLQTLKSKKASELLYLLEENYNKYVSDNKNTEEKDKSLALIKNITEKYKNTYYSQKAYIIAGSMDQENKKTDLAIENFEKALVQKETYLTPLIYMRLGFLYIQNKDLDKAEDYLKKAIDKTINPEKSKAMFFLATIYESKKEYKEAKAEYEKVINDYVDVYKNLSETKLLTLEQKGVI